MVRHFGRLSAGQLTTTACRNLIEGLTSSTTEKSFVFSVHFAQHTRRGCCGDAFRLVREGAALLVRGLGQTTS